MINKRHICIDIRKKMKYLSECERIKLKINNI